MLPLPSRKLSVLIVEDSVTDAELVVRELKRGGWDVTWKRVETEAALREALGSGIWDVVLADYSLPEFSAPAALSVVKSTGLDLPFIIVSGAVGEETAIEALKSGAHDFLVKGRWARLLPALDRELREAAMRRRQRDAEDSLRESEERFRTLVQSMNDIVYLLDRQQRIIGLFGKWPESRSQPRDWLGKRQGEVLGQRNGELHEAANARAFAGESVVYEYEGAIDLGRSFQASVSPVRDGTGKVVAIVGVVRDITPLKKLQEQLLASDRMASVGLLAAGLAHEINNPLASVVTNLELAVAEAAELTKMGLKPGELETLVAEAQGAAQRVRQIVGDLKVFSHFDDERGPVDVERVLDSALHLADNEVRHRARVTKRYGGVGSVQAHESRLGQVLLNLVMGTVQAIPAGAVSKNELELTTRRDAGRVVVVVSSTGPGPREDSTSFAICRRLAESIGGTLECKAGICLLSLPPSALPELTVPRVTAQGAVRRGRVLVVDDERVLANAIKRLLASAHDVSTVNRAEDALERIKAGERFDVILSDLMMPEMTGMDLHAEIVRICPEQAEGIVFMTGGAFSQAARTFLGGVRNPRLEKPFDAQHLLGLVNGRIR